MFFVIFTFYINVKHFSIPPLLKIRRTSSGLCPLEPRFSGAKEGGSGDIEIPSKYPTKIILQIYPALLFEY